MKEQLLLEGAVAGHMNHIYDNGEMTFGELKQLLQAISDDGKVRGAEKADGQNIFLSFNVRTQKAKAIRNKGHIKAGGLDAQAFDEFFRIIQRKLCDLARSSASFRRSYQTSR